MATNPTLFPLKFRRQQAEPIDEDAVFATTAERIAYLTSPRRYAGQVVADNELQTCFVLSADRASWLPFGGGGDALWREERVTESTPIDIPAVPTLFQETFTGAVGTFEGKSPDVNFNGQTVTWTDDGGDIPSDLSGTGLYIGDDPSLILKAYGTINGVGVFGEAQTMVVTFVFRTGTQVIPDPDEDIGGFGIGVEVGGLNFSAGFYYSDLDSGWRVTFDVDGTPFEVAAVTSITANTEYTGVLTINPGAQSLVLLGTTQNATAAFLNTAGLGRVDVNVCGGGYGISSITIVDPNAADSVIPGIVLDELVPDPTTPPAPVEPDYEIVQAVVLPEHELHVDANPFVYDPAILIRKLAFQAEVDYREVVDVVVSQAGTSVVHWNAEDPEDYQSVHIARANYAEHFGTTPPAALRFNVIGGETRPFFLQSLDVDPAANGRAYYHGYFFDAVTEVAPTALCIGCIKTANDLPASATNPYTTVVWQTTINASTYFESVSPTKCFVPGSGLIVGAVDSLEYYFLFLINLTTGAIIWKTRVDVEARNYPWDRLRITTKALDISGTLYFYVLFANTVSRYACSNGAQSLAKELSNPTGYTNDFAAPWAGFNGITIDTENNNYITVYGALHDTFHTGYIVRLQPSTLALHDSIQVSFDGGTTGVDTFAYNGNIIVARREGSPKAIVAARLTRSGSTLPVVGDAFSLFSVDELSLEFNGFTQLGGDTGAGDVNSSSDGNYPNGEHFAIRKAGNAYDVDVIDMLGGIGNFSSNGDEWQCLATTIGSATITSLATANISLPTSATTLVGVSTAFLAIQQPATPLSWVESNHIIPTNVLSELPRPSVKVEGITQTHALRLLGELPVPGVNLLGTLNDRKGDVRADTTGVYFCFEDYTTGVNPIWRKAPYLSTANLWTAANNVQAIQLPSGPSITIDATLSNSFLIGLTEDLTLNDPTGLVEGQRLHIVFRQFFAGWEVTWGPMFRFATGKPMQVGLGSSAISFMSCYYDGLYLFCNLDIDFVAPP
jgi:hypothetical protein